MAVRQRKRNGHWVVDVQENGYPRFRKSSAEWNKSQAKQLEAKVRSQMLAGTWIPENLNSDDVSIHMTFESAVNKITNEKWKYMPSYESGIISMRNDLLKVVGKNTPLVQVNETKAQELVNYCREKNNSGSTINKKLNLLNQVLRRARDLWLLDVKCIRLSPLKEAVFQGAIRWLEYSEEQELLEALVNKGIDSWQSCAELIICTIDLGGRRSEMLGIKARDVNFDTNKVALWRHSRSTNSKSKARSVPMSTRTREILARRIESGYKVPFGDLHPENVKSIMSRVRKDLGYQDDNEYVFRMFRHTCATRLVIGGMDLRRVQEWMGHTDFATTLRYAHLSPAHLDKGVELMDSNPIKSLPIGNKTVAQ